MGSKRVCEECGKEVEITFKFCPYCFTDFAEDEEQENLDAISSISALDEDESNGFSDEESNGEEYSTSNLENDESVETEDENGNVLFAGKYIVLEPLRSSPFGTICRVEESGTGQKFIMKDFLIDRKVLSDDPQLNSKIHSLLKTLSSFEHSSIISIADYRVEKHRLYVFYNYLDSTPCIKKIKKELPSPSVASEWIYEIINIVKYFHAQQKKPFPIKNFLPYSFVFTENESKIQYSLLGLPQIYELLKIPDPFEKSTEENIPEQTDPLTYDLISLGITAYYFLTGILLSITNYQQAELQKLPETLAEELRGVIKKLLSQSLDSEPDLELLDTDSKENSSVDHGAGGNRVSDSDKWLYYLGGTERTNSRGSKGFPYFQLLWSMVIPASEIYYLQPWSDKIVAVSDKGHIYELDRSKGSILRKKHTGSSTVAPIINNDIIYINSSSSQSALKLENLATLWEVRTKSMFLSPPLMIKDKLFTVSYDGFMMSVDFDSGNPETMENINNKVISAILNDDERIYITSLSGKILGINLETRIVDWAIEEFSPFTTPLAMKGDLLFAGDSSGKLICVNKVNGEKVWQNEIKGALAHGPVYSEAQVTCSTTTGILASFNAENGSKIWEVDFGSKNAISFCISDPYIYLSSYDHSLMSMNVNTGKAYNQVALKVKIASTPLFIDGIIYIVTSEGEVCAFAVKD